MTTASRDRSATAARPVTGSLTARLGERPGWLLVAALVGYILLATLGWEVPRPGGVPFGIVWTISALVGGAAWGWRMRKVRPIDALAVVAITAMAVTDVTTLATQPLRDLGLYLKAGERFLDGVPVYLQAVLRERPADLTDYPFLYPPLTLPFFGVLARLPVVLVDLLWVAGSAAAAIVALRVIGLPTRWALLLLAWPPFAEGLFVGNVAVPLVLLFALAPRVGAGLPVSAIFKPYTALASLWLIRERHVEGIVGGGLIVVALVGLTLPLVGTAQWQAWLDGLGHYQASQDLLPQYLFGFGLPRYVPPPLAALLSVIAVAWALRWPGPDGLARMGLATVIASPSLYVHGLLVALPAFLELGAAWLWLAFGITSVPPGLGWWMAVVLILVAGSIPDLRHRPALDRLHPLEASKQPWPWVRTP